MSNFNDEFDGQGGSYVLDPKTGKRVLKERTQEPADDKNQPTEAPAPAQE